jgi:hypothetical protein
VGIADPIRGLVEQLEPGGKKPTEQFDDLRLVGPELTHCLNGLLA